MRLSRTTGSSTRWAGGSTLTPGLRPRRSRSTTSCAKATSPGRSSARTWSAVAGVPTRSTTSTRPTTGKKAVASPHLLVSSNSTRTTSRAWDTTRYRSTGNPAKARYRGPIFEEYPIVLTTGFRQPWYFLSQYRNIPWLRSFMEFPQCQLHPDTAKQYGLEDGVHSVDRVTARQDPAEVARLPRYQKGCHDGHGQLLLSGGTV